jgi:hypothetical protein
MMYNSLMQITVGILNKSSIGQINVDNRRRVIIIRLYNSRVDKSNT